METSGQEYWEHQEHYKLVELEELFLQDYHEFFKSCNGYTKEEIDRKKLSLSNVMLLDNIKTHERRFKDVGFLEVHVGRTKELSMRCWQVAR